MRVLVLAVLLGVTVVPSTNAAAEADTEPCTNAKRTTTMRLDLERDSRVSCGATAGDTVKLKLKNLNASHQCSYDVQRAAATILATPNIPAGGGKANENDEIFTNSAQTYVDAGCQSTHRLNVGDTITFTITEQGKGRTWTASASVPSTGEWRPFFGVATLPNFDRNYYAASNGAGGYTVTRAPDTGGVNLAPAAFFKYHLFYDDYPWIPGLLAGLGLNTGDSTTNLIPFLGIVWEYQSSIIVSLGVTYEQQKRLKPEYQVGQTVSENLSNDALTRDVLRANVFFGIGYYFGSAKN